jgi:hypothetical protein
MTPEQRTYFILGMQCSQEHLAESLIGYRRALAEGAWYKEDFDYYTAAISVLQGQVEDFDSYIKHKEQDDA